MSEQSDFFLYPNDLYHGEFQRVFEKLFLISTIGKIPLLGVLNCRGTRTVRTSAAWCNTCGGNLRVLASAFEGGFSGVFISPRGDIKKTTRQGDL
jgi:hypothetical protein